MTCTACGRPTEPDDRFCTGCGRPLAAPTESGRYDVSSTGELTRTALVEHTLPDAGWDLGDPVWAATGAVPIVG
ncbi:MAG: zinc-ribbon domain-containing protein, partial [Ilumatobacteraceae bacterium]